MIIQAIDLNSGDDIAQPFVIYAEDNSTPQDLTGWDVSFVVKAHAGMDDVFAILNVAGVLTAPSQGEVTVTLTSIQTFKLQGVLFWILRGIDPNGSHHALASGPLIAKPT